MEDSFKHIRFFLREYALGIVCACLLVVIFGSMYGRILLLESEIDALDARGCGCVR